jgi:hypothetical protein
MGETLKDVKGFVTGLGLDVDVRLKNFMPGSVSTDIGITSVSEFLIVGLIDTTTDLMCMTIATMSA